MVEVGNAIRFLLNGEEISLTDVAPDLTLLDWLRLERRLILDCHRPLAIRLDSWTTREGRPPAA